MKKKPKNILVTGGAGYIGSHVSYLLIEKGYNVTVLDSLITGNKKVLPRKAKLEKFDIANKTKVEKLLKKGKFSAVLHFAGLIRVDESVKYPKKYMKFNYIKSKKFIGICLKNAVNKIIFSSTASVYGNPKKNKVEETDKLNPLNPYAKSKLLVEKFILSKSKKNNLKYVILRYFNVAGADKKMRTGLISKFSTHLIKIVSEVATKKRKKVIINGNDYNTPDGTAVRDYIHVSDLADIHLKSLEYLLKEKKSEIFNCGYGKGFSVKEVVKLANKLTKNGIPFEIGPRRPGDSKYVVSNPKKFMNTTGWKPKFQNLSLILKTAFNWEKKLIKKNY